MDIVIDGYNLIGSESGLSGALEHKRNWLIKQLVRYQEIKKFNLTVCSTAGAPGRRMKQPSASAGLQWFILGLEKRPMPSSCASPAPNPAAP
jgi:Predicted RNA-binding protein containing a PIN domain